MAVRSGMAAIITRVRVKINDPAGTSQQFADQDIQDVLDQTRRDVFNMALIPRWKYGTQFGVFDYVTELTDWEDDLVLKQFLTTVVTPSTSENIVGHWVFAATTLPPVFLTGKTYDIYRASADLLEMLAARYMLKWNVTADGQSLHREGALTMILDLSNTYRQKQRIGVSAVVRSDIAASDVQNQAATIDLLAATEIDYMASG